ncbi:MAG: hypothetical protein F7B59_06405 [Desulfurococcales archaeon]|nr:hypothetical protein [Desulfurococcales archaeon]
MSITMDAVEERLLGEKGKWIHILYPNPEVTGCVVDEYGFNPLKLESDNEVSSAIGSLLGSDCFKCIRLTANIIGLDPRLKPAGILVVKPSGDEYQGRYVRLFSSILREWTGHYTDLIEVDADPSDYENLWSFQSELAKALKGLREKYPDNPLALNLESFPRHAVPQALLAGIQGGVFMVYYLFDSLPFIQPLPPFRLDEELVKSLSEGTAPVQLLESYTEARLIVYDPEEEKYKLNPGLDLGSGD